MIEQDLYNSFVSFNINPIKICVLIIDVIVKTKESFSVTALRCNKIREEMENFSTSIIKSFKSSDELKLLLK